MTALSTSVILSDHPSQRRLGVAVTCTSCDEPILLTELLEQVL